MKIKSVQYDNRRKAFKVAASRKVYWLPYAKAEPRPSRENPVTGVRIDEELGGEGFTYELTTGEEGTVHGEQVLDYNRDPRYMRNLLLYKLTFDRPRAGPGRPSEQAGTGSPAPHLASATLSLARSNQLREVD